MFKKILLTITVLLLIACNNQQQTENTNQKTKNQLQVGINYTFAKIGICTESGKNKCITQEMYERLCKASEGITEFAAGDLTMLDSEAHALLNGGEVENTKVYWAESTKTCMGAITVSGIYKGTSTRKTRIGEVTSYVLNENKILVRSISHSSVMNN